MSRILVIDDDRDWLLYVRNLLQRASHEVLPLLQTQKLVEVIATGAPDLIITDIMMPGASGSSVYSLVREEFGSRLPVIVCSSTRMRVRAEDPLLDHVTKSEAPDHLVDRVQTLLSLAAQAQNPTQLHENPTISEADA